MIFTFLSTSMSQELSVSQWGTTPEGTEIKLFTLTNATGTRVRIAEYGALLVSVETVDKQGSLGQVTLSYSTLEEALAGGVFGSLIGRFANRIDTGGFLIDGQRFDLETFHPKTRVHIHGGKTGFHRQVWTGSGEVTEQGPSVTLALTSPDGHEGYPGKVQVEVRYTLTKENVLRLEYRGSTDKPTHLNLTNHVYFNLAGSGNILDHELRLDCETRLEIDDRKIPTGAKVPVSGTAFDFNEFKKVGAEIKSIEGGGYDHCYVIPGSDAPDQLVSFATLKDPSSGRLLEVATTKPGVQIYTANHFKGSPFPKWGGICFETQYYPDTPNKAEFPTSLLRPGETYQHTTEFRFGTVEP